MNIRIKYKYLGFAFVFAGILAGTVFFNQPKTEVAGIQANSYEVIEEPTSTPEPTKVVYTIPTNVPTPTEIPTPTLSEFQQQASKDLQSYLLDYDKYCIPDTTTPECGQVLSRSYVLDAYAVAYDIDTPTNFRESPSTQESTYEYVPYQGYQYNQPTHADTEPYQRKNYFTQITPIPAPDLMQYESEKPKEFPHLYKPASDYSTYYYSSYYESKLREKFPKAFGSNAFGKSWAGAGAFGESFFK